MLRLGRLGFIASPLAAVAFSSPLCHSIPRRFQFNAGTSLCEESTTIVDTTSVCGVRTYSHLIQVPVDHAKPDGPSLDVFVREVIPETKTGDRADMPCLMYLQGGPGFPAGRPTFPLSGWMAAASEKGFRILLLDQRGTGLSSALTPASLVRQHPSAEAQAEHLSFFRADSIVRDCEVVRRSLCGDDTKLTLLGQSFGGFVMLTYLSLFPGSLERCLFTFGLAPVMREVEEVYAATFQRMMERNRRFLERYPSDETKLKAIATFLETKDQNHDAQELPSGGRLTLRRFLQSGLLLGRADGMEALHYLLEDAWEVSPDSSQLSSVFLDTMDKLHSFETNPLYWLLHEAIYMNGPRDSPSAWAAQRIQGDFGRGSLPPAAAASLGPKGMKDLEQCLRRFELPSDKPIRLGDDGDDQAAAPLSPSPSSSSRSIPMLTGEMVYSWMASDFKQLAPLADAAQILAQKKDWPPLYNLNTLDRTEVPCAALVSYEDVYVERRFSEETAKLLGPNCKVWITNEFQHSGLRDDPARVFDTLLDMANGQKAIPS